MNITKPLTTKDLAERTGLSMDYFQKLARVGKIPCRRLGYGVRARFLFDSCEFEDWWQSHLRGVEPCPAEPSANVAKSGTGASGTKAKNSRSRLKQEAKLLHASVLANG